MNFDTSTNMRTENTASIITQPLSTRSANIIIDSTRTHCDLCGERERERERERELQLSLSEPCAHITDI